MPSFELNAYQKPVRSGFIPSLLSVVPEASACTPDKARFDRVVKLTSQVLQVPVVNLSLLDDDHLWLKHTVGMAPTVIRRSGTCCGYVAQQDGYLEIPDLQTSQHRFQSVFDAQSEKMRFYAGYPVHDACGHTIGSFCIMDEKPRTLSELERDIFFNFKEVAEGQLHTVELSRLKNDMEQTLVQTRQEVLTDSLTGVWNRKGILNILEQKLNEVHRTSGALGVVFADIDHFKAINDRHGHAVGDEVLAQVAERVQRALRNYDAVGRIGGEEFLIVVSDQTETASVRIAERIRQAIKQPPFATQVGPLSVSMSLGVAVRRGATSTATSLMAEADRCLYDAKKSGRNCVHGPV